MAKSMCSGCKHWVWCEPSYYGDRGFHYCDVLETDSLFERKFLCNGKFKNVVSYGKDNKRARNEVLQGGEKQPL